MEKKYDLTTASSQVTNFSKFYKRWSSSLKTNMQKTLIENPYMKNIFEITLLDGDFSIKLPLFNTSIKTTDCFVLISENGKPSSRLRIDFSTSKNDEEITLLSIYISPESSFTCNSPVENHVCDVQNEYCGKLIIERLFNSLIDKGIIYLK